LGYVSCFIGLVSGVGNQLRSRTQSSENSSIQEFKKSRRTNGLAPTFASPGSCILESLIARVLGFFASLLLAYPSVAWYGGVGKLDS